MSNASPDRPETEMSQPLAVQGACPRPRGSLCRAALLGSVGLVAACLSWAAIRQIGEVFDLSEEIARLGIGQIPGPEDQKRIVAGELVRFYKHVALWVGTAGVIIGGLLGLAIGLIRRSRAALLTGTAGGVLFGGAFGAGAGALAVCIGRQFVANLNQGALTISEYQMMLMHGTTWLVVGTGVGFGTSFATNWRRTAGSTLISGIAGALGGALYPLVASVAMPLVDASFSFPEGDADRLLWLALPGTIIGLALGRRV